MGIVESECENLILDCYRLAKYYHIDPRIFLDMPLGEVATHMRHTIKLAQIMRDEAQTD